MEGILRLFLEELSVGMSFFIFILRWAGYLYIKQLCYLKNLQKGCVEGETQDHEDMR